MKKHLTKVLLGLALTSIPLVAQAAPLTLVKDGKPNATIILQNKAPNRMKTAANDLQKYIQKITGVKLPLKTDGKDVAGVTLNVGKTATAKDSDFPNKADQPETYAITQRGDDVYFTGDYPSPTAFAVYSFLEDQLGVRWFAPGEDWEYVPQLSDAEKSTFTVDVKDIVSVPGTSPRVWSGHNWTKEWDEWNLRNKAVQSEKVFRRSFQNYIHRVFPPSKYGKTHPEYYPLINGKRWIPPTDTQTDWWPCMGNPDVQRVTVEYIRNYFKEHPDADSFSLGMDDIYHMCDDPLCKALDAHPDDYKKKRFSTRFYKFVNIVASDVKKTNPDKTIGVLIYSIAKQLPEGVPQLEDNVFGYIADGSVAQWYQPGKRADWMRLTREWRKRVARLSRYDYYGMGTHVPRVFPHAINDSIKFDKELGFEGMYVEVYTFLPQTAPMIWSFAKLQWEPETNIDLLLQEFYSKMYPTTAVEMESYFDLMENSWNTERPGHVGWVHRNILHQAASISPEAVHSGLKILDEAYEKAATPVEKRRIDVVRGGLKFGSFAVLEFNLARKISALPVTNEAQAEAALEMAREFAELSASREDYWAKTMKRDDILGANVRGFNTPSSTGRSPQLQSDFSKIENPAVAGLIRIVNWYQANQPGKIEEINKFLDKLPSGLLKESLEASRWLASDTGKNAKSLLKNGDFENKSENTAETQHDWDTKGIPVGWSSWSRFGSGKFIRTAGRAENSTGVQITALQSGETSDLIQTVPVKPGEKYVTTAWVKLDNSNHANSVEINLRYRDKSGWYDKAGRPRVSAVDSDGWQQLMLATTIPDNVTDISLMLGVSDTSAVFDDVRLHKIPN